MVFQAVGRVIGTAMQKTAKVAVTRTVQHKKYEKYIKVTKKYLAHDANELCTVGDDVIIKECMPISKRKRFEIVQIVRPVEKHVDPDTGKIYTKAD